jgi:hypothetical protein
MIRSASRRLRALTAGLVLASVAVPTAAQAPRAPLEFYATILVAGFERPLEVRQAGLKRRTDVATGAVVQSFIADRTRGLLMVMTAAGRRRLAFVFPIALEEVNAPLPLDFSGIQAGAQRMTRMGGSTVAGKPCTLWRYVGYMGKSGVACASLDGIVLQFTPDGRKTPLFQVQNIIFVRQDPRWFMAPPDYQISVLPGVGGPPPRPVLNLPAATTPAPPAR